MKASCQPKIQMEKIVFASQFFCKKKITLILLIIIFLTHLQVTKYISMDICRAFVRQRQLEANRLVAKLQKLIVRKIFQRKNNYFCCQNIKHIITTKFSYTTFIKVVSTSHTWFNLMDSHGIKKELQAIFWYNSANNMEEEN